MTFAELEYDSKKRRTRREIFLEKMEGLIPWQQLEDRIEPFYAKAGRGRRPYPLGVMLRDHCVQLFYNLSDPGMEDLLYEVESVRRFAGLRLSGPLPDETTILNFRHLLETQGLGMGLFEEINVHLASLGHRLKTGTIVDASIIDAPSSTKNRRGERDPEMHQTKKGNPVVLRAEGAYRCDAESGLAHSLATTAANAADVKRKASVRAKVEHPFLYVKRRFGYGKVRYRGLAKNTQRIALLLGFSNLLIAGRYATGITRGPCAHGPREGGSRTHRSDFLTVRTVYPARQPTLHRSDRPS